MALLSAEVDRGEAAAIALARQLNSPLLILDDMAGRRLAKRLGLTITGTVGVVLAAAERGFIVDPFALLEALRTQGRLWLYDAFLENLRSAWQPPV
jgi:predicted nucleic acid-binding protein